MKKNPFFLFAVLLCLVFSACNKDNLKDVAPVGESIIWSGPTVTFEKADGADPALADNQDRITSSVWITRSNDGGEIYNANQESNSDKNDSPSGTAWAIGNIEDIDNLQFGSFRTTVKPKEAVGKNLILFIEAEKIFIPIKFTKWSSGKDGGFAYERASN